MPLTKLQSRVLGILGPRFSRDIDTFQDSEARLESVSQSDAEAIASAGLNLSSKPVQSGKREAEVHDSAFRFFPTEADDLFGYVLHPIDLAANKASAAADRREPRDVVDLLTIHETILPLGAVICAAVGRFPGQSPEEMLADITRHSRFTAEEFAVLSTVAPLDVAALHRRIRSMLDDAAAYIAQLPSDAVGFVFLEHGIPVQPDLQELDRYQRRAGSTGGIWPSSPEISRAMLDRYRSSA